MSAAHFHEKIEELYLGSASSRFLSIVLSSVFPLGCGFRDTRVLLYDYFENFKKIYPGIVLTI